MEQEFCMRLLTVPFGVSLGQMCLVCVYLCVYQTLELRAHVCVCTLSSSPKVILSAHKVDRFSMYLLLVYA